MAITQEMMDAADPKPASIYAAKSELEALRDDANGRFALLTYVADLERQIAELKSLYQDTFNMAARAVADIADAADRGGDEQQPTMGEKMLSMIRGEGAK